MPGNGFFMASLYAHWTCRRKTRDCDLKLGATMDITRGGRGSVKAASLDEISEALDRPYTDEEVRNTTSSSRFDMRGEKRGRDHRGGPPQHGKKGGHDKASHRPGSPSGRGKRRGKR